MKSHIFLHLVEKLRGEKSSEKEIMKERLEHAVRGRHINMESYIFDHNVIGEKRTKA
jgi:hypothetical protein